MPHHARLSRLCQGRVLPLFFLHVFFFPSLFVQALCVCFQDKEYLDLIDCNYTTELYAAVRCTSTYLYTSYTCQVFCCCCSVCCYTAAAVRHRVPDGKNCCCGSLHLIPMSSFSSFKHNVNLMYAPLGSTVAFAASIYL